MTRRSSRHRPEPTPSKLRRADTWSGLRAGDPVQISDTGLRSATWAFVAHVTNVETGQDWVEVVGGARGDRKVRSFAPARVYAVSASRKRGDPSLAEAPRLPLG
ncbi:MAG: DUF7246 family protein [Acidimicrobiales bacterium]